MSESRVNSIRHWVRLLRSPWFAMSLIVLAVSAVYSNTFYCPFVFDDLAAVGENPSIRSLWLIWKVLTPPGEGMPVQGRPVVNLSLAVNYALGGEAAVGYHLVNLAIHILTALVLFGIVRRTLSLPGLPQYLARGSTGLALATALLWAVHPLCTAAVTYITQRTESLMALFYLLTLYCVIRSATARRKRLWQTAAVLACLLGMGSKEVMVSAPLVVLLYDRVFLSQCFKECFRQRGALYAGLAATWVWLAWLVLGSGTRGGTAGFGGELAWWAYALTQCRAVVTYLKLCFWPHPLIFDYGAPLITDPIKVWPQAVLLVLVLGGVSASCRWQSRIGFLGLCFFAILAPSSSVVPVTTQTIAEHRMYLPLAIVVGLGVLLVYGCCERIWWGWKQGRRQSRWALAFVLIVTATILGGLTFRRNQDYGTALDIWTDTAKKCPANARALQNRGNVYLDLHRYEEAVKDYSQAIALKPDWVAPYNNRGNAYENLGQLREALDDLNRALALKPDYALAYYNRGNVYRSLGQPQQALADFTDATALQPDYVAAYNNRGNVYQSLGEAHQALADFTRAIALQPDHVGAYINRGNVYQSLGQPGRAIEDYSQAIALKPDYFEAYSNRGAAYHVLGEFHRAIEDYNQAIQLSPNSGPAHANRAAALCRLKQYDRAWADVAKAKELGYTPPAELLRMLREASGRAEN